MLKGIQTLQQVISPAICHPNDLASNHVVNRLWTIIPHPNPEDVLFGIRQFHSGGGIKGSPLLKIGDNGVVRPLYPPDVESSAEEINNQKNNDGEDDLVRFGHG